MSFPLNLVAAALLRLNNGDNLLPEQVAALTELAGPPAVATAASSAAASMFAAYSKPEAVAEAVAEAVVEAAAVAEAAPEAKAKKPRKAKTVKPAENEIVFDLLAPVDMPAAASASAPAPSAPSAPAPSAPAPSAPAPSAPANAGAGEPTADPLRTHSSRLATVDATLCQARKIDEKNPIVGTRKEDDGANGMFYPEKQCGKKPVPGQKLCATCAKKEEAVKNTDKADKTWYGRLDEPLYWNAKVVGCKHFFDKYPEGIKSDATTRVAAPVSVPAAKPAAKKVTAKKTETKEPIAVANTAVSPKDAVLITFLIEGKPHIRSTKNGNTYTCDLSKTTREESVIADNFVGCWKDGALDKFAEEADNE